MAYCERKIRLQKNIYGKIPFLQTFLIMHYLTEEQVKELLDATDDEIRQAKEREEL